MSGMNIHQAEVIRFLHARNLDAELASDGKVQVIQTVFDKNGYVRQYRQVINATIDAARAFCH
jgi:hypothetical protein